MSKKSLYPAICILRAEGFKQSMKLEKSKLDKNLEEIEKHQYNLDSIDAGIELLLNEHSK